METHLSAFFEATADGNLVVDGTTVGTWTQKGRKVVVKYDPTVLDTVCDKLGAASCELKITKANVAAKLTSDNSLKGKLRITGKISLEGQSFKFKVRGKLDGTRVAATLAPE